jgi:hypothetical protein
MKLVDFHDFEPMNKLRSRMGAELISKFQATWDSISEEELENQLRTTGVLVDFNDIVFNDVGYSTYKNKLVLFYIKTQIARYFYKGYKFHFSKCSTISSAIDDNRNSRYVISKRTDGIFNVILRSEIHEEEREVELKPCKNCLKSVNYKGYAVLTSTDKDKIYNQFDIAEFIDSGIEGSGDSTLTLFRHEDLVGVDDYPENFNSEIRPNTLKYYNYTCNQCSIKLDFKHKQFLQVHHKNADKSNNMMSNLELLCIECHSNQKGHGHSLIKTSPEYKEFLRIKDRFI